MKRRPKLPFLNKRSDNPAAIRSDRKGIKNIQELPIEILSKIFKFLSPSDVLRCARTCRTWLDASNEIEIWRLLFRRLPKRVQKISLEAKKATSYVNWKKETIVCLKKARKRHLDVALKKKSTYTGLPEKTAACIRSLEVQWSAVFTDSRGAQYEVNSRDIHDFATSISVCWNEVELPPVGELRTCALYANSPLFCDKNGSIVQNSVCTRSFFTSVSLKDFAKNMILLGKDQFISIFYQSSGIIFGVWHDKSIKKCSIAFITVYMNIRHIIDRILCGTSNSPYICPPHVTIIDDLDGKYGLQRYSALIEIRTNRKLLWNFQVVEFYKAQVENDWLVMTDERPTHQGSFDIRKSIRLPWKSGSIKGIIKNVAVIDFAFIDGNKEFIWCTSEPVQAMSVAESKVDFDDDGSEKLIMLLNDPEKGTLALHISVDKESDSCAVRRIEVRLKLSFIDQWFGTLYSNRGAQSS